MIFRKIIISLGLLVLCCGNQLRAADGLPVESILQAFGEGCSMNGSASQPTTDHAKVLVKMLAESRDDSECDFSPYALASANLYYDNASTLDHLGVTSTESEYLMAMREERILLTVLANAKTNPELYKDSIATIESQLEYVQRNLVRSSQFLSSSRKSQIFHHTNKAYNSLVQTSRAVTQAGTLGTGCWTKAKPWIDGFSKALTGLISSSLPYEFALPVSGAAELTVDILNLIRRARITSRIDKVSDSIAHKAYQCAIEKFSDVWCEARDRKKSLEAMAKELAENQSSSRALQGMSLLDEHLPVLLNWLEKVSLNGDPLQTSMLLSQKKLIDTALAVGQNLIQSHRTSLAQATEPQLAWQEYRSLVSELRDSLKVQAAPLKHPIFQKISEAEFPYLLADVSNPPKDASENLIQWENFVPSGDFQPSDERLSSKWVELLSHARRLVLRELQVITQPDVLFSQIFEKRTNQISPAFSLEKTLAYLTQHQPNFENAIDEYIYIKLITKLSESVKIIQSTSSNSVQTLADLRGLLELDQGSLTLENEIRVALRLSMNDITKVNGPLAIRQSLILANPDGGVDDAMEDANSAQSSTFTILQEFGNIFQDGIKVVLENYIKKEAIEGTGTASRDLRAALCLKLYGLPVWPKKIKHKLCEGTNLQSIIPGGPSTAPWSRAELDKKLADRICAYHDFKVLRKVFQDTCKRTQCKTETQL